MRRSSRCSQLLVVCALLSCGALDVDVNHTDGGAPVVDAGISCLPSCAAKTCGTDDGCGASCQTGSGCAAPTGCTPLCAGQRCGMSDFCGGTCQPGSGCTVSSCAPSCSGKSCGASDSCGGTCQQGSGCTVSSCTPICGGKSCGVSDGCSGTCQQGSGCTTTGSTWWKPAPGTSWQWQLSGALDSSFNVQMYDIDLFETSASQVAALKAQGRKVVCYFDTAYEPGRPESATLAPYRGNAMQGWPGQYWLDLRAPKVLEVMRGRIALAQQKGCDGIEADDVDHVTNNPGHCTGTHDGYTCLSTNLTAAEQLTFIRALIDAAHQAGLSFALKNDLDQLSALVDQADFAINEECFAFSECGAYQQFIARNKAVFQVEYTDGSFASKGSNICPQANAANFDTLIKRLDLTAERFSCR